LTHSEVALHLDDRLHIESGAVSLVQEEHDRSKQIYLHVSKALAPLAKAIQTKVNRSLPPSVNLPMFPVSKGGKENALVTIRSLYDLHLSQGYMPSRLQRWGSLQTQEEGATGGAEPAPGSQTPGVAKAFDSGPELQLINLEVVTKMTVAEARAEEQVLHGDVEDERYVKGVVLEPGIIDKTRSRTPDGGLTEGDTYDEDAVRRASFHWMECSRAGARLHTRQGGTFLKVWDVCLLENYLTDAAVTIGGAKVRKGTWVQAWRIYDDQLWQLIKAKEINAFSIGAFSQAALEAI
jgi:hypothetical protein